MYDCDRRFWPSFWRSFSVAAVGFVVLGVLLLNAYAFDPSVDGDSVSVFDSEPEQDFAFYLDAAETESETLQPSSGEAPAVAGDLDTVQDSEGDSEASPTDIDGNGSVYINAENVTIVPFGIPEDNEYPPGSPLAGGLYMQVNTGQLGNVLIYVPIDFQRNSFTYDASGNVVNLRSSQITGFMYRGNTLYNVRWAALQTPEYRLYNTSNTYQALTIRDVLNTNIIFIESNDDIFLVPQSEMYQLILITIAGAMMLCLFMKRF